LKNPLSISIAALPFLRDSAVILPAALRKAGVGGSIPSLTTTPLNNPISIAARMAFCAYAP